MKYDIEILFKISVLISKSLAGEMTEEEKLTLEEWCRASAKNEELYQTICSDHVLQDKVELYMEYDVQSAFDSFVNAKEKKNFRRRWMVRLSRYTAIVVLSLFMGLIWFHWEKEDGNLPELLAETETVNRNMPVLTLSDGRKLSLGDQDSILNEENGVQVRMRKDGGIQYNMPDSLKPVTVYHALATPSMCDFFFVLADGTKVWLNAKSSLKYPVMFPENERVVYAGGEVYFEVAKDAERPFFVVADGMKIEVLGTSFNVNSYEDEKYTELTLVEGHVKAHVDGSGFDLLPDRQLRLDKENRQVDIRAVNVNDYIAWRCGQYVFKGRTLAEVSKVLQRWYDIEVVFRKAGTEQTVYTGVVCKEENFDVFVRRLRKTSSLSCRREGNKLYVE